MQSVATRAPDAILTTAHSACFSLTTLVVLARHAARFLVVDDPQKSDAIVVLAGETKVRPVRALELTASGAWASHVFLDAETRDRIYDQQLVEIAQRYVNGLGEGNRVTVCPIAGFSTLAEADDAARCLQSTVRA
jgi:hypothetical protein